MSILKASFLSKSKDEIFMCRESNARINKTKFGQLASLFWYLDCMHVLVHIKFVHHYKQRKTHYYPTLIVWPVYIIIHTGYLKSTK